MEQKTGNINNSVVQNVNTCTSSAVSNVSSYNKRDFKKRDYWHSVNIAITVVNVLCCIAIICALCLLYPRTYNLGFDYLGLLVGILGLFVTVLLGYQIYSAININEKLKEIDKIKLSNKANIISLFTLNDELHANPQWIIHNYIAAIEFAIEADDQDAIDLPLGRLNRMLNNDNTLSIYKSEKKRYIKILNKSDRDDVDDLINAINNAKEV